VVGSHGAEASVLWWLGTTTASPRALRDELVITPHSHHFVCDTQSSLRAGAPVRGARQPSRTLDG
jgi:hypothetical protein